MIAQATANRTIEQLATRDALTGLLNRHGFRESGAVLTAAGGPHRPADVRHVRGHRRAKTVNDSHGHLIGDLVIVRTAQALASQCREGDLLCRWGGDEFVILGLSAPPMLRSSQARVSSAIDMTGLEGQWAPAVHAGSAVSGGEHRTLIESADRVIYLNRRDTPARRTRDR